MSLSLDDIGKIAAKLERRFKELDDKSRILRDKDLRRLAGAIKDQPQDVRAEFGRRVNELKSKLKRMVETAEKAGPAERDPLDLNAPFDANLKHSERPRLIPAGEGSIHPISKELDKIREIFLSMGFDVEESPLIDDEYHMFDALNFPPNHPARDDYDTFTTDEGLLLPAHTSTMQNRVLKSYSLPIRVVIPGRIFRNEDVDATHEHTFYQCEGLVVDRRVSLAEMIGTLKTFLEAYLGEKVEYRTQPFYFPFVEPGLEYLIRMPKALRKAGKSEWLEILGCGMVHPNVLREGGLDPAKVSGFAWGMGIERLIMLKYGIGDMRYFESGRLDFLKQFGAGL